MSETINIERKRFLHSLVFPFFFVALIWMIKFFELIMDYDFTSYSLYPRKLSGMIGIITSPLLHADFKHLLSNSVPILILGVGVFYFYNKVAYQVLIISYLAHGLWLWAFGRESYHLGASGLVYSFFSFLFFSGIIRKNINLLAISLTVAFWYGSMIWGIFPQKQPISWEGHLMGFIAGLILAIYYRHKGPQPKIYQWEIDEEEDDEDKETAYWEIAYKNKIQEPERSSNNSQEGKDIKYHYSENKKLNNDKTS